MSWLLCVSIVVCSILEATYGQERRPTISFITQPEIVTDIGGDVSRFFVTGQKIKNQPCDVIKIRLEEKWERKPLKKDMYNPSFL